MDMKVFFPEWYFSLPTREVFNRPGQNREISELFAGEINWQTFVKLMEGNFGKSVL